MKVEFKCPTCGQITVLEITEEENAALQAGKSVQDAMPTRDIFFREVFISHCCYDCISKTFNMPKPGEDWGEVRGECKICGCKLWEKDTICPCCHEPVDVEMCDWHREVGKYLTDCGRAYFPYIKDYEQPVIEQDKEGNDICPWCGKLINYIEADDEE